MVKIHFFLHADTQLPPGGLRKIVEVLGDDRYVGGAFDLDIDSERVLLKFIAARARFRSRLIRIPYGDQAIFVRKSYFEQIGGFKDIPLMEFFIRRSGISFWRACIIWELVPKGLHDTTGITVALKVPVKNRFFIEKP